MNRRNKPPLSADIDECDAHLAAFCWHAVPSKNTIYVRRAPGVYLHRHIMGLVPGDALEVDHVDGNGLNNRRANLRVVSHAGNNQNRPSYRGARSAHRGVSYDAARSKWLAQVVVGGRRVHYGRYDSEEGAAAAAAAARAAHMPCATSR